MKTAIRSWRARAVVAAGLLGTMMVLAACGTPAAAPAPSNGDPQAEPAFDAEAYFRGRTIEIMVPFGPGGTYDVLARFMATHIPRYVPGQPRAIVTNSPGGGGLLGLQRTMRAAPDGYTIGQLHPRFVKQQLRGEEVPDFDVFTAKILGTPSAAGQVNHVCADRNKGIESWDDALARAPLTDGGDTPDGAATVGSYFIELLGGPVRVVLGYTGGTGEVLAGFDRGELDLTSRCNTRDLPNLYPEWIAEQRLTPLYWWDLAPPDEFLEELGMAHHPPVHVFDVPGINPTDAEKAAFEANLALNRFIHTHVMHPDTPDEIFEFWLQFYKDWLNHPEFLEPYLATGRFVEYGGPEELAEATEIIRNLPEEGRRIYEQIAGE